MNLTESDGLPVGDPAAIRATAAAWLCERDEGFSPERAAAFAAWAAADLRHRAAVEKVERGLVLLHRLPAARAAIKARLMHRHAAPARAPWRRRIPVFAWPAGLAATLLLGFGLWRSAPQPSAPAQIFAATSLAPKRATLDDGSVVNVNTHGELVVELGARERHVTLARGEAHFVVKPDSARPFVVVAGGVKVRAVGTMFLVRLSGENVEVIVEEGKVTVTPVAPAAAEALAAPGPLVLAGESAVVSRAAPAFAPHIEKMNPPAMSAALRWHRRVAVFNDESLTEVVAQFNRRNAVQLVLADPALGARRFGGVLALDQVDALVRLLEKEGGVAVERRGETEIMLRQIP